MSNCNICPRKCNIDRAVQKGRCLSSEKMRIARADLHMWEEPCISGDEGSGTIFFSGCNLGCIYCQNQKISRGEAGRIVSPEELCLEMLRLQNEKKANNINLVTAGHFVLQVKKSIELARGEGLTVPIVYNTSSYENYESIRGLDGYIDVYLPDFKYYNNKLGRSFSGVDDYRQVATLAIDEMVRQCGETLFNERDIMTRGVIVRHLVLPRHTDDSKEIIRYLYDRYGDKIFISIMNQYTPMGEFPKYPELGRKVTTEEYDEVVDFAIDIGVENGFIQEGETALESFIPQFFS